MTISMVKSNAEILKNLLAGNFVSDKEHLLLKDGLKPVFFYSEGFMSWVRGKRKAEIRNYIAAIKENLINNKSLTPDDIVDQFATLANELNQGWQLELFYDLYHQFIHFESNHLANETRELVIILKNALLSTMEIEKSRAITLIAQFAEMSNAQSRKSTAGIAAEGAIELVLRSVGLVLEQNYGSQFKHYNGSDTDFVVWDSNQTIKAYIAVQSSTNDRLRLSSSELQDGGKRYMCSLNGCGASSKTTKDIGNALIGGQSAHDTYYVVIETERLAAIEEAKTQIIKAQRYGNQSEEGYARARLLWLENHAINYSQFAEQIKNMMSWASFT